MLKRRNKLINRAPKVNRVSVNSKTNTNPADTKNKTNQISLNSARIRRNARVNTTNTTSSKSRPTVKSNNNRTGLRKVEQKRYQRVSRINKNTLDRNRVKVPISNHKDTKRSLPNKRTLRSVDKEARNSGGQKLIIRYNKPYGLVKPLNSFKNMTTKTVGGLISKIKSDLGHHNKVAETKHNKNIVKDNIIVEDITDIHRIDESQALAVASKHIIVKHVFVHKL